MLDPLAQEVRLRLRSYLAGQATLRELWLWLQTNIVATGVERTNAQVLAITGPLLLNLYEYSSGRRTEPELRSLLLPLLTTYPVTAGGASAISTSTSARSTPRRQYSVAA